MHTHFVWWKHGDTAEAKYALTPLFYVQTSAIYRFYTYQLVIDDAPAIVHGQYWPLQNLGSSCLTMGSSCRGYRILAKKIAFRWLKSGPPTAPARQDAECYTLVPRGHLMHWMDATHLHSLLAFIRTTSAILYGPTCIGFASKLTIF